MLELTGMDRTPGALRSATAEVRASTNSSWRNCGGTSAAPTVLPYDTEFTPPTDSDSALTDHSFSCGLDSVRMDA